MDASTPQDHLESTSSMSTTPTKGHQPHPPPSATTAIIKFSISEQSTPASLLRLLLLIAENPLKFHDLLPATATTTTTKKRVKNTYLPGYKAARLRLDVFGERHGQHRKPGFNCLQYITLLGQGMTPPFRLSTRQLGLDILEKLLVKLVRRIETS
ncbi:Hypothetical predicted protein, partial [Olea europaea subsp. europaea]